MRAFLKKEVDQYLLTNKWVIFVVIFAVIGIMNPLTAKLTPTLLREMLGEEFAHSIGEPTAVDAWLQFFKNMPQLGLIAFILMMANAMSKELQDGTLLIFLAKGLKRRSVILAKLVTHSFAWTIGYLLAIGITYLYTLYYWDQSIVQQLPMALFAIYLFGLSFIFLTFLGNTITNSTVGGFGFSGIYLFGLILVQTFSTAKWNPLTVFSNLEQRLSANEIFAYTEPLLAMVVVLLLSLVGSILHFNKRVF